MILNQDLSKVVPHSKLSEELRSRSIVLQEEISRIEKELMVKTKVKPDPLTGNIKKVEDSEGQVKIWSSS